ncbi:MAG: hypothetical protein V3U57_00220 [Robiginitomaculum sp.]
MTSIEHKTTQNPTTGYDYAGDRGSAEAYWNFGIPAQGTLVEYHLRAYGSTDPIPNETIRFIPDCPSPRTGIRRPAMVAKIENIHRVFAGVYIQYLNSDRIVRCIDDDPDGALLDHDIIDWKFTNTGVIIGDPLVKQKPLLRIVRTLEDALVAQQNKGGGWVYDISCDWNEKELPPSIAGFSKYRGLEIDTKIPSELAENHHFEISKYRKLVFSERKIVK